MQTPSPGLKTLEDAGEEERLNLEEDVYMLEDGAAEDWTRANPLQQQRADPVLGQVIAWVEDGQRPAEASYRREIPTCRRTMACSGG